MTDRSLLHIHKFLLQYYRSLDRDASDDDASALDHHSEAPIQSVSREAAALLVLDFECFLDIVISEAASLANEENSTRILPRHLLAVVPNVLRRMRG